MRAGLLIAACLVLAGASCALAAPTPDYDPWAWLTWGRELTALGLSTDEGPAFKPLPVAVSALLAPLGEAAPTAWVVLVRGAGLLALALAFAVGRRVAADSKLGGAGAAAGVLATGGFLAEGAAGNAEVLLLALSLAAWLAAREERPRAAIALASACALVRVEAWPFALGAAAVAWRRRPEDRPLLAAAALGIPALWLVPELLGSGELLRSAARARELEPGQPALGDLPALGSLRRGLALVAFLLAPGIAVLVLGRRAGPAREGLWLALAGLAWLALVAAMAQMGFSGEERYALPGAALLALAGGAGVGLAAVGARRAVAVAACAVLVAAVITGADRPGAVRADQRWRAGLDRDLGRAIERNGGPGRLLACGRPYVGRFRGTLLAYRLGVPKRRVGFSPRAPGVVFGSRLRAGHSLRPASPEGFTALAAAGRWRLAAACGHRRERHGP